MKFWGVVASPGASLLAGMICLVALWWKGKHRDRSGAISRSNVASAVMLTAALYTMIILVIGEFYVGQSVSMTIKNGFGDGRAAWLLLALALDTGTRVYSLFDDAA